MLTAAALYKAASLDPAQFGPEIVDLESAADEQRQQVLDYIDSDILPGAKSEVSVPFREATGYGTVAEFVNVRFPSLSATAREELLTEGEALYDAAVKSYARSELNKVVDTDSEAYDKDSDQDRIQGNQRLAKLITWAQTVENSTSSTGVEESTIPVSTSVRVRRVW
jgi:hypothetical protein